MPRGTAPRGPQAPRRRPRSASCCRRRSRSTCRTFRPRFPAAAPPRCCRSSITSRTRSASCRRRSSPRSPPPSACRGPRCTASSPTTTTSAAPPRAATWCRSARPRPAARTAPRPRWPRQRASRVRAGETRADGGVTLDPFTAWGCAPPGRRRWSTTGRGRGCRGHGRRLGRLLRERRAMTIADGLDPARRRGPGRRRG